MSKLCGTSRLLFALVGLGASVTAAYVHYQLLYDPPYTSFCDVNATVSCTQVYQSRFGTVRGVPVALSARSGLRWSRSWRSGGWRRGRRARERPGLPLRDVDARRSPPCCISATRRFSCLKTVCIAVRDHLCRGDRAVPRVRRGDIVSHDYLARRAVAGLPRSCRQPARGRARRPVLCGAALDAGVLPARSRRAAAAAGQRRRRTATPGSAVRVRAVVSTRSRACRWSIPTDGAKVLVVKFNDYQCPACRQSYLDYKPISREVRGRRIPAPCKFVPKDFPLDSDATPTSRRPAPLRVRRRGRRAARAAAQSRRSARGVALHAPAGDDAGRRCAQAAHEIGAGRPDFDAKYAVTLDAGEGRHRARHAARASRQTPTFFVNGVKVDGRCAPQYLRSARSPTSCSGPGNSRSVARRLRPTS